MESGGSKGNKRSKSFILNALTDAATAARRRSSFKADDYKQENLVDLLEITNAELQVDEDPSTFKTCVVWLTGDKIFANGDTPQRVLRDMTRVFIEQGLEFQKHFHLSGQIKNCFSAKFKGYPFLDDTAFLVSKIVQAVEAAGYNFVTISELNYSMKLYFTPLRTLK